MLEHVEKILTADEESSLDSLNELSGAELLELQALADKITVQIAVVIMAREYLNAEHVKEKEQV